MSLSLNRLSVCLAYVTALALIVCGLAAPAYAAFPVNPVPFVTNPPTGGPIGFSYAGNKFVGTVLDTIPQPGINLLYSTNLNGTGVAPFGNLASPPVVLAPTFGREHYVSSSLNAGQGGFPINDIYVASGNNIIHISNDGLTNYGPIFGSSTGGITGDVRGITFDATGAWGGDMLVTTHDGYVYRVNSSYVPTQIAFEGTGIDTEGLDVCPLGATQWSGLTGNLFVASEGTGLIHAIKPGQPSSFAGTVVASGITTAEQLSFVPMNLGASGSPLEGMYSANWNASLGVNVLHAPASDFTGMQGDLIVTGEGTGNINGITAPFTSSQVGQFTFQPEDGVFVTADIISGPEPTSLVLLSLGGFALITRRRRA